MKSAMGNIDLLGDSDGNDEEKDLADIKVNKAYAQRFAHNKQREALHRLQELEKRGYGGDSEDDESSEEEEDEDGYIPERTELQFYETLSKVKKKDPVIYQKNVLHYDDDDEEEEEEVTEKKKTERKKAMYLKDVTAQHLLENGPDFDDEDKTLKKRVRVSKTYAEEQDELKREFLMGAEETDDGEDGDGLLTVKKKTAEELRREKREEEEAIKEAELRAKDADIARRLEDYFGKDDDLDEKDRFLKSYLLNKGWIDSEKNGGFGYDDIVGVSEDEEELLKQDKFEASYNFRFEEGAGDQVLGHARFTEGSVRKKPNARKQQRENKKERIAHVEFERKEELKHLKNIKKEEIMKKLEKIRQIAGIKDDMGNVVDEEDLDDDFDPEEYDRKMREAFGDDYYWAPDADENFEGYEEYDLEKPDFDMEDELLGLPKGWDGRESKGFAAARQNLKEKEKLDPEANTDENTDDDGNSEEDELKDVEVTDGGEEEEEEEEEEEDEDEEEEEDELKDVEVTDGEEEEEEEEEEAAPAADAAAAMEAIEPEESLKNKKRRKGRISLREKLSFDKQLEEYYKLDYEDMIGDLPTRFKYREVRSNTYGLSTEEILMTDDKELNQYVSIKKLAPYRSEEWKAPKYSRFSQKKRKRIALQDGDSGFGKGMKKSSRKTKGEPIPILSGQGSNNSKGEVESKSKKKRRRQKKAPIISLSRLAAYGKVPIRMKKSKMSRNS